MANTWRSHKLLPKELDQGNNCDSRPLLRRWTPPQGMLKYCDCSASLFQYSAVSPMTKANDGSKTTERASTAPRNSAREITAKVVNSMKWRQASHTHRHPVKPLTYRSASDIARLRRAARITARHDAPPKLNRPVLRNNHAIWKQTRIKNGSSSVNAPNRAGRVCFGPFFNRGQPSSISNFKATSYTQNQRKLIPPNEFLEMLRISRSARKMFSELAARPEFDDAAADYAKDCRLSECRARF